MSKSDHLRALLGAFQPRDEAQAQFLTRMRALEQHGDDAFARDHFEPGHFTASAFIVDSSHERLLLILHGKLHLWLQPGGHVDADDSDVIAAARREIAEEVGLVDVKLREPGIFDIDVHAIPALRGEPAHLHFDVRFLFEAQTDVVTAATDAEDARWFPLDEVSKTQSDASVMRAVRQLRQH